MMATRTAEKKTAKTAKPKAEGSKRGAKSAAKKPKASKTSAAAKKPSAGSSGLKAKSPVKKALGTKSAAKARPTAKPAAKAAAKAPAPKKAAAKEKTPARKVETKKSAKAATASAAKAPKKPAASAKPAKEPAKAAGKKTKKTAPVAPKPAASKKKMLVGQKPRSQKTAPQPISAPLSTLRSSGPMGETAVTASPPSAEAKQDFKVNDYIVYPAHGVGRIVGIEKQLIAGVTNELFLIDFEQEKMRLRVPTGKAKAVGMRGLSDPALIRKAVETLKGRARVKRTMWSRRAQEYEAKINSGDINSVAEVVRDLYRASDQPEQSYSERQLFEAALDRLAREVAAVNKTDMAAAIELLESTLQQKRAAA